MKPLPASVKDYWQKRRVWDRYQEEQHPTIGAMLREQRLITVATVRDFAALRPGPVDVADLCCGTGWIANDLMQLGRLHSLLAADVNEEALHRLETEATRLGLQNKLQTRSGDLYRMDWGAEKSFDVILCMDALHHLPDIPGMLEGIRARLKDDGIFVGNIRAKEGANQFFDRYGPLKRTLIRMQPLMDRVLAERSALRRWLGSIGYFRILTFSKVEVERLLAESGFSIQQSASGGYHWFVCGKSTLGHDPNSPRIRYRVP